VFVLKPKNKKPKGFFAFRKLCSNNRGGWVCIPKMIWQGFGWVPGRTILKVETKPGNPLILITAEKEAKKQKNTNVFP